MLYLLSSIPVLLPPLCDYVHFSDNGADIQAVLAELTGQRSVPNVFVNGRHVGGCDKTIEEFSNGSLARKIIEGQMQRDAFDPQHKYDYDLVVIGGGSGGLACAKVGFPNWFDLCTMKLLSERKSVKQWKFVNTNPLVDNLLLNTSQCLNVIWFAVVEYI